MKYFVTLFLLLPLLSLAQENYKIQVYASPAMEKSTAIVELHSNYTFSGEKNVSGTVRPSYHALHETLEITAGIARNFEIAMLI